MRYGASGSFLLPISASACGSFICCLRSVLSDQPIGSLAAQQPAYMRMHTPITCITIKTAAILQLLCPHAPPAPCSPLRHQPFFHDAMHRLCPIRTTPAHHPPYAHRLPHAHRPRTYSPTCCVSCVLQAGLRVMVTSGNFIHMCVCCVVYVMCGNWLSWTACLSLPFSVCGKAVFFLLGAARCCDLCLVWIFFPFVHLLPAL